MGFNIKVEGSSWEDGTPKCSLDYILEKQLRGNCPTVHDTLFYESNPHKVSYDNLKLEVVLRELDDFVGGFVPKEETNPNFDPLVKLEECAPGRFRFETPEDGDDEIYAKEVAYYLKKVIEYALKERRNLEVD
ncbi:MAG: hypothetical protein KAT77_05345 [Nanoarchaeota archaeon]|nr:hypothetical protein [Nanoarchaeota archaeon]